MELDATSLNRKVLFAARRVLMREKLRVCARLFLAGSVLSFSLLVISRFLYIPYTFTATIAVLALSAAVGLFLALRRKISPFEGACELDSVFSLKERLATAIELQEKGDASEPLALYQLADSVRKSELVNPTKVRIGLPKEVTLAILFLILCASVTLFPPLYSTDLKAKEMRARESIRLQLARKSLREEEAALTKAFDETAQNIEKGKIREALASVTALREDLSLEYSKAAEKERALAELEVHPQLARIAQALRENSPDALSAESERLSSEDAGGAEVAQILKDIAQEIIRDIAFRAHLERLVRAIEARNQKELEDSLRSLAASINKTESPDAISKAIAHLEVTEEKLIEASGGSVIGHALRPPARVTARPVPSLTPEETVAPAASEEIEQAIVKQNVPERFRHVVREYFSR